MTEFERIPAGVVIESSTPIHGLTKFSMGNLIDGSDLKIKRWLFRGDGICHIIVDKKLYNAYGCKVVGRIKNKELLSTLPNKEGTVILMIGDLKNKPVAAKYDPSWGKGMGAWLDKDNKVVHQSGIWDPRATYIVGNPHIDFSPFITQV